MHEHDPQGRRLPIKVDSTSNGEHIPRPVLREEATALRLASANADMYSRRLGQSRRQFLKSACGSAATLLAFNQVWSMAGARGGRFAIPEAAAMEPEAAEGALGGEEVIIDMQTHCVDPSGEWATGRDGRRWKRNLTQVFSQAENCPHEDLECYSAEQLIKEILLDSDTDVAVISGLWGGKGNNPTPMTYAAKARDLIRERVGEHRGYIQGLVLPNEQGQIEFMDVQARKYNVSAWKLYPQWGPDGTGFFMDDPEYGIPMLERARDLGIPVVAAHRGLPLPGFEYRYSRPEDIVRVGRLYPDMTFLCYHSGFEYDVAEGPYDPENPRGVDRLILAHQEREYRPNQGNVYAELGSCWRHFMSKPDQAAHFMGKLLKHFGEERICWGTDCLWYGSPQDQIQAFRSFEISEEFQERYGYPPLDARAKKMILGENAARIHGMDLARIRALRYEDEFGRQKAEYRQNPNPSFLTYGPKTRREFFQLLRRQEGFLG